MEPCFNPAVEAQAIGRVHRLGQKRTVKILRLIVKDSVESRIVDHVAKKFSSSAATDDTATTEPVDLVNVGSIQREKATLVREELDDLFGVAPTQPEPEEPRSDDGNIYSASL